MCEHVMLFNLDVPRRRWTLATGWPTTISSTPKTMYVFGSLDCWSLLMFSDECDDPLFKRDFWHLTILTRLFEVFTFLIIFRTSLIDVDGAVVCRGTRLPMTSRWLTRTFRSISWRTWEAARPGTTCQTRLSEGRSRDGQRSQLFKFTRKHSKVISDL